MLNPYTSLFLSHEGIIEQIFKTNDTEEQFKEEEKEEDFDKNEVEKMEEEKKKLRKK